MYHDPKDEPIGDEYENAYENNKMDISEWKIKIFNEIKSFVPRQKSA